MKLRLGFVAVAIVACVGAAYAADQMQMPKGAPPPKPIPRQYVQVSPCIPTMGEHYANPKVPDAPIYGVYQGKPVFTEIMVLPKDLAAGKSWNNVLQPLPGYQINHVDIGEPRARVQTAGAGLGDWIAACARGAEAAA